MFRKVIWLTAVLCLLSGVCTAEQYWSKDGDLYYHAFSGCLGKEGMLQQDTSGKAPCPICLPVKDGDTEIRAVERGGTVVVRVPDGWTEQYFVGRDDFTPDEDNRIPLEYFGRTAHKTAAAMLNGDDYASFMQDWESGSAKALSIRANIYAGRGYEDNIHLHSRRIDGATYDITHSANEKTDKWDISAYAEAEKLWTEGDTLFTYFCEWEYSDLELVPESMKGSKPVFSGKYDNLEISVYDAIDTHIAVLHEPKGDNESLENVGLCIGSHETDILMNGYMNGKTAVFCCVLTDAEIEALENGSALKLVRPSRLEGADFMNSAYASVRTSNGKYGIIDRSGEWVIDPKYDLIDHSHEKFLTQKYFLCWTRSGKKEKLTVLDGNTLEKLFIKEGVDSFGSMVENPSILSLYPAGEGRYSDFYLLPTGEKLFNASDFYDGNAFVNAFYGETVEGFPRRLVIRNNKDDRGAYLADNYGDPVTGEYAHIIALLWKGDQGLFLAEQFSGTRGWCGGYIKGEVYDGREIYYGIEDYRCGLIDQDGNAVTGMDYVAIHVVNEEEIILTLPDGRCDRLSIAAVLQGATP